MLQQIYIILNDKIIYKRIYAKGLDDSLFMSIFPKIKQDIYSIHGRELNEYNFFKSKISYIVDKSVNLIILFVSGLTDTFNRLKTELYKLKKEFLDYFGDNLKEQSLSSSMIELINPIIDNSHKNLKPKISIVGFSGVGKTTITKLIKSEEIPMQHIPTITGDVATIKIGNLHFFLWDFAGQEQFNFLWNKFIRESDAVLLITDSTLINVEKSKFFLNLIRDEAPYANTVIIANKQDLPTSLPIEKIEDLLGLKAFSMIAIDPDNKHKMIRIIANLLEINPDMSPLLQPLIERNKMMDEAQIALTQGDYEKTIKIFEKLSDICLELGDDTLGIGFKEKADKLKNILVSS